MSENLKPEWANEGNWEGWTFSSTGSGVWIAERNLQSSELVISLWHERYGVLDIEHPGDGGVTFTFPTPLDALLAVNELAERCGGWSSTFSTVTQEEL